MLPYIVLLLIPSLFALFNARTISLPLWIFAYIYFVLFVGLRQDVGPDWPQYGIIHSMMPDYRFPYSATRLIYLSRFYTVKSTVIISNLRLLKKGF